MNILICAATPAEAMACKSGLAQYSKTRANNVKFSVLKTGMGMVCAEKSLNKYLSQNMLPDLIISSGFAGTYSQTLNPGDWVWAESVYLWRNPDASSEFNLIWKNESLPRYLKSFTPKAVKPKSAVIVTAPVVIDYALNTAPAKLFVGAHVVVDMESAALATVCKKYGANFAVLRMITDTPQAPFPVFVGQFAAALDPSTTPKGGHISRTLYAIKGFTSLVKNPLVLPKFIKSGRQWLKWLESGWASTAGASTPHNEVQL